MGWSTFWRRFRKPAAVVNRKRNAMNGVGARAAETSERRRQTAVIGSLVAIFLGLAGTVLWLGVRKAAETLLYANPEYRLRVIDIVSDGQMVSRDKVKQWAGIEAGLNMHAVDIGRIRSQLLRRVPVIKSVTIVRRMPDTLEIRLSERLPIISLGRMKLKGADQQGFVFSMAPSASAIPIVTGYAEEPAPGAQLEGRLLNAVEVVDVLNRTQLGSVIRVDELDVRDPAHLLLRLAEGTLVFLNWPDMAMSTPESRLALDGKLRSLARVMEDARLKNRRLAKVDMTFNDDYIPVE